MMALSLILVPLALAALAYAVPPERYRPWLMPIGALGHLLLVGAALQGSPVTALGNWLVLDPLGKVFLGFVSVLFFLCALYTALYVTMGHARSNRIFCACFLLSLSMITLVILSHHLGLMWVGMEATTLAMAPNIYFYHTPRSLEATWKYLLICSVGIAMALFGLFFLAYATLHTSLEPTLLLEDLVQHAPELSHPWLRAAFVLVLVGFGTKMGL